MRRDTNQDRTCAVCGKTFPARHLVGGGTIRPGVMEEILRDHPEWTPESSICRADLNTYRGRYVHTMLESERGDLTTLEQEVVHSLKEHEILSRNVEAEQEEGWAWVQRWWSWPAWTSGFSPSSTPIP